MDGQQLRIVVVGDELVAGVGDAKGLGWVGRVAGRTHPETPAAFFPLAVPGEITTELQGRWAAEAHRRFSHDADNRLVIGLGRSDIDAGVSIARSRLNLANMLDEAEAERVPVFVVGPPPLGPGSGRIDDVRLRELSAAFADVCDRRRVPFVDNFTPLQTHEQWLADLAMSDGVMPGQAGYGLMAWLVLHSGWQGWLGLAEEL